MAEIEAKFHLTDKQALNIIAMFGSPYLVLSQADTYFNTPKGVSLRIRDELVSQPSILSGRRAYLTVKTVSDHHNGIRAIEELEPSISPEDIERWTRVFHTLMGFTKDVTVNKKRHEYHVDVPAPDSSKLIIGKLVIDEVADLGYFCEIEILSDDIDQAKIDLQHLIDAFGLSNLPPAVGSYRYMLNNKLNPD